VNQRHYEMLLRAYSKPARPTCAIQWVGDDGRPTPDDRPAVGYVRRLGYRLPDAHALNGFIEYSTTEWFPICAEHAKRLTERGMHHWEFREEAPMP
jgi:hypothetical protein